ncbi:NAD(P)-dependent oxidoreductase [Sulfitobacter sp. SK012]|uniref:NAD(P)-dependent oxidoreductase n=1 Tax=Sulfitobacter sp. SK012 TaxID=1389005 RepID=UPI000E0AA53F|nr:NAD(P)-dependent oxidoreductase [Sulfitobacter sp. SK012]AXI47975.1 NAD(P)-dependent oxidoreductase [Sulfitobacter sp. SK012]
MEKVGIIGVGLMGHGIAMNIAKSGREVSFLDHPGNQPTDDLTTLGARAIGTGADIAKLCDVIIICVTGTPQVEDVLNCEGGVLAGISPGTVVIDCSTAIPNSTLEIAKQIEAAGGHFLDAPMTRTPKEAAEGRLNLIVGGDKALFDAQLPLFETYAENVTYVGGVGAGHTMKLIHNYVSLGFSAVLSEAAATADKAGIDPLALLDVLQNGGGRSVVLDRFTPFLTDGDPSGLAFSLSNAAKDISYYQAMSDYLEMAGNVSFAVAGVYADTEAKGEGNRYVPELISLLK